MFFLALFVWIPFFGGSAAALAVCARGASLSPSNFRIFVFFFLLLPFQNGLFSYVCFSDWWNFDRSVGFFVGKRERANAGTQGSREA